MKVVLSRKGFDSSYGGVASPILPDGTILSLPIPSKRPPLRYHDLYHKEHSLGRIVQDLARSNFTEKWGGFVHLDPDIRRSLRRRPPGWRPLFGQVRAARGHLVKEGIGKGDLFLFFGWFRRVCLRDGHYAYVKDAPNIHVLFGWMQVERVYDLSEDLCLPSWAKEFPHFGKGRGNIVYVARKMLHVKGLHGIPGAGVFGKYREDLQLTTAGHQRTRWCLPRWFYPRRGRKPLTYHEDSSRWSIQRRQAHLQLVARGQEFVFDTSDYPEALSWVKALFRF